MMDVKVLEVMDAAEGCCDCCGCGAIGTGEVFVARDAVAELMEAAVDFSKLYGHLFDTTQPQGGGFLSPESVEKYDEAHERLAKALARCNGGAA